MLGLDGTLGDALDFCGWLLRILDRPLTIVDRGSCAAVATIALLIMFWG